uniref:Uncharacterized protein n=1 Tax=Rhizophora mucronata TaxID=61149 RepID=A0A2P2JZ69_RHIMU
MFVLLFLREPYFYLEVFLIHLNGVFVLKHLTIKVSFSLF